MLTELYIDALLVDEELADLVWEAWDVGAVEDYNACIAWTLFATQLSMPRHDMAEQQI